jgi:hypothetical protein
MDFNLLIFIPLNININVEIVIPYVLYVIS